VCVRRISFIKTAVFCAGLFFSNLFFSNLCGQDQKQVQVMISKDNDAGISLSSEKALSNAENGLKHYKAKWENAVKALENDPDNINLLKEAGKIGLILGKRRESLGYYKRAVALLMQDKQGNVQEMINLQRTVIYLYLKLDKINMSVVEYKKLCSFDPDNMNLVKEFAEFLKLHGFPERAFEQYKKIIDKNPDDLMVIDQMMQLYDSGYVTREQIEPYRSKMKNKNTEN